MEREQAVRLTQNLLRKMVEREGSDLFLTKGFPPAIKVGHQLRWRQEVVERWLEQNTERV